MEKGARWIGAVAVLVLAATACGGGTGSGSGGGFTGSISISGSSTVQPISSLVAELFAGENPEVAVSVDGPGTGDGFALFCDGQTDISDASRPIKDEEAQLCEQSGIDYVELRIGLDGITVMTNPANEAVSCLSKADLYALIGPESQGFSRWSDANELAAQLGGTGSFPDAPLEVIAPGEESGTYDAFVELAGFEDVGIANGLTEDEATVLRPDYQASADDNVILQGIEGSTTSLGFVGFAYAEGASGQIKELGVDGGSGCIAPSIETIADGSYPLSRALYIYVNTANAESNPTLAAFVDFYLSDGGVIAVEEAGYVALPAADLEATRSAWAAAGF